MYHSSAFARERDKIRQAVLEGLGWQIFRIWSTDWWTNKAGALSKLDGMLREAFENTPVETSEPRANGTPDDGIAPRTAVDDELENGTDPPTEGGPDRPGVVTLPRRIVGLVRRIGRGARAPKAEATLAPYAAFEGSAGPDPRHSSEAEVAEGLCRIIHVEEPMLVERAYRIYLRGCDLRNLGRVLKRQLNKALQHAIRRGLVVTEDEWNVGGLVRAVVRSTHSPPVVARRRGPRSFDEIPPSELQLVARQVLSGREDEFEFGSDEHLRAVLHALDLKRLTTRIGTTLLDVLERRYPHVDEVPAEQFKLPRLLDPKA